MVLEIRLSAVSPEFWQFGLGAVLVAVVLPVRRPARVLRQVVGGTLVAERDSRPAASRDRAKANCASQTAGVLDH